MAQQPPKTALRFLRWFCREDYLEEIEGDLFEVYEQQYEHGPSRANWNFTWQVLRYFRPDFIKSFKSNAMLNPGLLKQNLLITYRGFLRNRTSFLINLIGLSTGLACAFMIYLWVTDERGVDKFHAQEQQLYQVMKNAHRPNGIQTYEDTPALLAKALLNEMPEVEQAVSINNDGIESRGMLSHNEQRIEAHGLFASRGFFQIFSYPLLYGNRDQLLTPPNAIVLSETLATKLFGNPKNSLGKTVRGNDDLFGENFQVTGVFARLPDQSTMQFDFIINYDIVFEQLDWVNEWTGDGALTYLTLKKGTDLDQFNNKITALLQSKPFRENKALFVQRYSEKYLYGQYENGRPVGGRIAYVRLFSIIGIFLLLIACFNFMNLSTAQASHKMKEIGVKKAMGVSRRSLVFQFLGESLLITFLSFLLALGWMFFFLPQLNELTGKHLQFNVDFGLLWSMAGIGLGVGLLSGLYPAFYLSGFDPVKILKGKLQASFGELWVRRGLVVLQFAISLIFIVGFLIVNQQIKFIQNTDLGYNRENVLHFTMSGKSDRETFMAALKNIPGVINATNLHSGNIVGMSGAGTGFSWGGAPTDEEMVFQRPHVGYDFIETLDIDLIEGRSFSRAHKQERTKLIINKAAAEIIGQEDIVGKTIMDGSVEKEVIGVVDNFKIKTLHEAIKPCIIRFIPNGDDMMVKIKGERTPATIEQIETVYNRFQPEYPFNFTFIDDDYQALYVSEQRVAVLSTYFTMLAVIISCLGLFGLAAFAVERRTKEIGIRKVLGAGVFTIVQMLSKEFTQAVLAAILIALPISYLMVKSWLSNFAYHLELHWWFFLLPGLLLLLIAWMTIGMHTLRAARVNPATSLKSE